MPTVVAVVLAAVWLLMIGAVIAVATAVQGDKTNTAQKKPVTSAPVTKEPQVTITQPLKTAARVTTPARKSTPSPTPPNTFAMTPPRQAVSHPPPPAKPAGPVPVASWRLGSGPLDLGADAANAHPLLLQQVTKGSGHGGCAVFDGRTSQAATGGPVLDTRAGSSFTVSAWVYLTKTGGGLYTAVSQDSVNNSAFYLEYSSQENRWAFARVSTDEVGATPLRALSTTVPKVNTWTHLVGVFDASSSRLLLYVDGTHEGTTYDLTPYGSNGPLVVGRAKAAGGYANWWPGRINNVAVYAQALTAAQVKAL
jgi:hypothetical protein